MKIEDLKVFVETELNKLERGIVATPQNREHLEAFTKANQGSNDFLVMQMAIQFGFKLAMENVSDLIKE